MVAYREQSCADYGQEVLQPLLRTCIHPYSKGVCANNIACMNTYCHTIELIIASEGKREKTFYHTSLLELDKTKLSMLDIYLQDLHCADK